MTWDDESYEERRAREEYFRALRWTSIPAELVAGTADHRVALYDCGCGYYELHLEEWQPDARRWAYLDRLTFDRRPPDLVFAMAVARACAGAATIAND